MAKMTEAQYNHIWPDHLGLTSQIMYTDLTLWGIFKLFIWNCFTKLTSYPPVLWYDDNYNYYNYDSNNHHSYKMAIKGPYHCSAYRLTPLYGPVSPPAQPEVSVQPVVLLPSPRPGLWPHIPSPCSACGLVSSNFITTSHKSAAIKSFSEWFVYYFLPWPFI